MVAVSWIAALVCCLGYGLGSVLQSIGARRAQATAGLSGIGAIAVQWPYLLGLAADGVAFVGNVVALQRLPLFLVQAIVTASVGVTAVTASLRGTRLGRLGWWSLAVLGAGLLLLGWTANPEGGVRVPHPLQWAVLGSAALPVLIGLVALGLSGPTSALAFALAAGLAWSGVAVAARGVSGERLSLHLLGHPLVWSIVLQGVLGAACFALALQRGHVTSVTATVFVVEMIIPSVVGLALLGDRVEPGRQVWAVLGFALAVGGTVALVRLVEEPRLTAGLDSG